MWVCLKIRDTKIQWFLIISPIQMVILEYTQYTPFPTNPFHPAALDHVSCDLSHTAQQTFFRYHLSMKFMAVAAAIRCTASTDGKEDAWPAASLIVGPRALGCFTRALGSMISGGQTSVPGSLCLRLIRIFRNDSVVQGPRGGGYRRMLLFERDPLRGV